MMFYWGIALISGILTKISSVMFEKKHKHVIYLIFGIILSAVVVCIVCCVAGFRDPYCVGTDTAGYGLNDFHNAISLTFQHFSELDSYKRYPILCKLIMWSSANVAQNFFVYLFILEAFTFVPVYIASVMSSKSYSWISVFVFCSWMLPISFNAIRQCMAVAITLVAIYCCTKNKIILSALFVFIAWQIHSSASIAFFYIPIYLYLKTYNKFIVKKLWFKSLVVVSVAFISQIFAQSGIYFLFKGDENFDYYATANVELSSWTVVLLIIFLCFFVIVFMLFKKKDNKTEYFNIVFMIVLFAVGISSQALGMRFQWLFRIAYYFFIVWILLFAKVTEIIEGKYEKLIFVLLAIIFIMAFTYGSFEYKGYNEVVPYVFRNNIALGV